MVWLLIVMAAIVIFFVWADRRTKRHPGDRYSQAEKPEPPPPDLGG